MRPKVDLARALVFVLITWATTQAVYAAWTQDWTYDERFHLEWSRRLLEEGVTERESALRLNSKTPISLGNVVAQKAAEALGVASLRAVRFAARLPTVLWLLALFAVTYSLAQATFGGRAGVVALGLAALDPNLVAHGSLATVDVPYAVATLAMLWTAVRFARHPSAATGAWLGAALGLAFVVKFSAFLLLPGLMFLPLAAERPREWPAQGGRIIGALLLAVVVAWLIVAAAYLFMDIGPPLSSLALRSLLFQRLESAWPGLRLPLPAAFLTGLDRSMATERFDYNVVLLGHVHRQGAAHYFLVLWILKTPLLVWGALVVGLMVAARRRLWLDPSARFLLLNLVLALGYFSCLFKLQAGYRYVLMCVPLAYVLAAGGLAAPSASRRFRYAAAVVVAASLLEGAWYVGNPLSFTNVVVQPKRDAFRYFADSNLDWGQNREKVAGWLEARGIAANRLDPPHVLAGLNVFGVNNVAGVWGSERYRWLREQVEPVEHLGHTYLLYDIGDDLYERFLAENRTWAPSAVAARLCPEGGTRTSPGEKAPFAFDGVADATRAWLVCVVTARGSDVGLRGFKGNVDIRHLSSSVWGPTETLYANQVLWFRLEPGAHVFLAQQVPNRRPWLPSAFEGEWHVRRRGATIAIREVKTAELGE